MVVLVSTFFSSFSCSGVLLLTELREESSGLDAGMDEMGVSAAALRTYHTTHTYIHTHNAR